MIESYCRYSMFEQCKRVTGSKPLVKLKGSSDVIWEFDQFFSGMSGFGIILDNLELRNRRGRDMTFRKAVGLLSRNGEHIGDAWIRDVYNGDWLDAIRKHYNYDEFFADFEKWFAEKRRKFMDKTAEMILAIRPDIKDIKLIKTNSHGGVANLLKVLTKTMNEQGSTIQSIAKMQFCVCTQAGIYLPDEFITDVLTAVDMDENTKNDRR